jgi:hypothetical protein
MEVQTHFASIEFQKTQLKLLLLLLQIINSYLH